ncbi:hypothetical protein [Paracoccus marcusii]|uniref:hypothetical protein n=1 Tax=Paracoccus marcusii TaxID=59779 RepID=UPI003734E2F3
MAQDHHEFAPVYPGGAVMRDAQMRILARDTVLNAMREAGDMVSGRDGAAALLGVAATTLYSRLSKYGVLEVECASPRS